MTTVLGILSDSHGRAEMTARAVAELESAGATLLLHLGDVETEAVIDELIGHEARLVFGNCDDVRGLASYAENVGVTVDDPAGDLDVEGRRVVFTHGHHQRIMADAVSDGAAYLLHGHSHEVRDERVGATRVINPGALFRAARYTVAVLTPATDRLEFIEIGRRR